MYSLQAGAEEMCADLYTSEEAILKTYMLPINLEDPKGDFDKRIAHCDYRFISVNGLYLQYPGLKLSKDKELLDKVGHRSIEGTSDALENEEHADLVIKFGEYAESYNKCMLSFLGKGQSNI
jgi:hypothetical protein